MDYQNGIIPMAANPEKLLAGARQAIDLIRSHGGTICYVRVGFADAHEISGSMGKRVGGPAAALEQRPRFELGIPRFARDRDSNSTTAQSPNAP